MTTRLAAEAVFSPYNVRLTGAHGLTVGERIAAEIRFIGALQQAVGGPNAILDLWQRNRPAFDQARVVAAASAWAGAKPAAGAAFELQLRQVIDL